MGDGALAQAAQRGRGVSLLQDLQKSPGHGPGQPALGVPSVFEPLWDSVNSGIAATSLGVIKTTFCFANAAWCAQRGI